MAHKSYHHKHRLHRRRHNPFSGQLVKDAAYNAAGALASLFIASQFSFTGWTGVGVTGAAAVGLSFVGKLLGKEAGDELLKGGLTATIISALHQAGFAKGVGLGLYAPSYFAVPTSSDQYGRSAAPGMQFNRGAGSVYFDGPGTAPQPMLPAVSATGHGGMGFHRFRSRYAGNY